MLWTDSVPIVVPSPFEEGKFAVMEGRVKDKDDNLIWVFKGYEALNEQEAARGAALLKRIHHERATLMSQKWFNERIDAGASCEDLFLERGLRTSPGITRI